jgi:multidrug resistance protein
MAAYSSGVDEATLPTIIPLWRRIFDQGCISKDILIHDYDGSGTEEDPYQVSWLENDPCDPMNFSDVSKWLITLLVSINTMAVALVSSAYSGGIIEVILDFQISEEVAILGISFYVLGFGVGPLFWAPFSEIYGRRYILIASAVGLTAFIAGAAGSQNIKTLIILRFFAGLFSAPLAVAGGVIADCFPAVSRGLASGLYCAAPFLGPTLGPIVGGFLSESAGWRWVEGLVAAIAGVIGIITVFTLPETYAPVLLKKRAERLSATTGQVYRSKLDIQQGKTSVTETLKVALSRPWQLLFREPIVLLLSIYLSIIYGM